MKPTREALDTTISTLHYLQNNRTLPVGLFNKIDAVLNWIELHNPPNTLLPNTSKQKEPSALAQQVFKIVGEHVADHKAQRDQPDPQKSIGDLMNHLGDELDNLERIS